MFDPEGGVSSLNGLFPGIGFRLFESLGAESFSDVAETHLYTIYFICIALKKQGLQNDVKNHQLS